MPRCAVCGQDNPGGFRFCGACGASLAAPARAPAEERRLVTVLFCDLVGFTARSDQADPEDVGALLRPYHTRLRTEIERLGGTLDKFIGDGVMAVFGAPVAHEDDPERAVRCALGMLAAIEELNQARPALDLAVRIGITTGEALVRPGAASRPRAWSGTWSTPPRGCRGWPRRAGWWWGRRPSGRPAGCSTTRSWGRCG